VPSHRRPLNKRTPIYTAIVVAVAVFAAVLGFGGASKGDKTAAQTTPEPASPSVSSSSPDPTHSASARPTGSSTPTSTPKPSPKPTPSPTSTGLGTSSATLGALAERVRSRPVSIRIPALQVDAPIIGANVGPTGALEVPDNVVQAAWYQAGAAPGQLGTAIIAAHVDFQGKLGLFNKLHTLPKGAVVYVTDVAGTTRVFRVAGGTLAPKNDPSTVEALAAAAAGAGRPRLALITCGGDLDSAKHTYYDNYVLLADL
jgi:Sortase domain